MPTFRCKHVVPLAVPVKASFPKPCAGGNNRLIPRSNADLIERYQMLGRQGANAPACSFEIIDQNRVRNMEFIGQTPGFDDPGKI